MPFERTIARALMMGCLAACSGKTEPSGPAAKTPPGAVSPSPSASGAPRAVASRHLLLVVELEPEAHAARVLLARAVELPLPLRRGSARSEPWRVEVLSARGAVLFAAPLADASELRAEAPDPQTGELRGVTRHKRVTAVTLRLPELPDAAQIRLTNVAAGGTELARVAYPRVVP